MQVFVALCSALSVFTCQLATAEGCAEKKKFLPVEGYRQSIGMYARVHPSGDFVLVSGRRGAIIYDLRSNPVKSIETAANDETYPVEGTWSLIASPNHSDGMEYFSFNDLLRGGAEAKPQFNDADHNEYYHSSAELPGSTPRQLKFRTSLYDKLKYRDYTVKMRDGKAVGVEKSEVKRLCMTVSEKSQDKSSLPIAKQRKMQEISSRRSDLAVKQLQIQLKIDQTRDRSLHQEYVQQLQELRRNFSESEAELVQLRRELGLDGSSDSEMSQPILSKDGKFIAAMAYDQSRNNQTLQIFKIEGSHCVRQLDTGFATGKPSFSYPDGKKPKLAFTATRLPGALDEDGEVSQRYTLPLSPEQLRMALRENPRLDAFVARNSRRGVLSDFGQREVVRAMNSLRNRSSAESIYLLDSETKKLQRISKISEEPSYPGFTRDGRVIYMGNKDGVPGFFVVDPNQMEGGSGRCIPVKKSDADARAGIRATQ